MNFWFTFIVWDQSAKISAILQNYAQVEFSTKLLSSGVIEQEDEINLIDEEDKWVGHISIRNLTFSYHQQLIFDNFSLEIAPGSKIALVGESGTGKSTLFNLLTKIIKPPRGAIFIDNIDICDISKHLLRQKFNYILQKTNIFEDTLLHNIILGKTNATHNEVDDVMDKVSLRYILRSLSKGYNTLLGGNSHNISGGEAQRVNIARSLLKNAPICLCDEITSSLDYITSKKIFNTLFETQKNNTLLLIDHSMLIVHKVEKIIFFTRNCIIIDTHDNLLKNNEFYRSIFTDL